MGAYDFNKSTYKPVTLRLNRIKDSDIIRYLDDIKSVNGYIMKLIRADMKRNPYETQLIMFEVVEQITDTRHDVLKGFETLNDAMEFMYMYVATFVPVGRVYIVQRFSGILPDGYKVKCGKVLNIKVKAEKEDRENA